MNDLKRGNDLMTDIVRGMTVDDFRALKLPAKTAAAVVAYIADANNDPLDLRSVVGVGRVYVDRIASHVADKYMDEVKRQQALRAAMIPVERIPPAPAPPVPVYTPGSARTSGSAGLSRTDKPRKKTGKRRRVEWQPKEAAPFEYIDVALNGHQIGAYMDLCQVHTRIESVAKNYDKVLVEYKGAGIAFTMHSGKPLGWARDMSLRDALKDWHRRAHPHADILGRL